MQKIDTFILLAEDDEDDQELIRIAFEKAESAFALTIVANGQEALDLLSTNKELPSLIILDLNMPLVNGLEALKEISKHKRFQGIPKVILTTSDAEHNRENSLSHGAIDYFVKPYTMAELVNTAKDILKYIKGS